MCSLTCFVISAVQQQRKEKRILSSMLPVLMIFHFVIFADNSLCRISTEFMHLLTHLYLLMSILKGQALDISQR